VLRLRPYVPAYTINAQIKDLSVVLPPAGFLADQFLIHLFKSDWKDQPTVQFIAHSNVNFGDPVLSLSETVLLARWLERIKDHFVAIENIADYYRFAMDVEFKFVGPDRKLYIKQARPYPME
jgi:pyruvate,water dikinase